MHLKLEEALKISKEGRLLVHCWRGGMRSEAMAWLFSLGGLKQMFWKAATKHTGIIFLNIFRLNRKMIILGGLTGSGKTHILGLPERERAIR